MTTPTRKKIAMTTTPQEPDTDPDVVPSGDPVEPSPPAPIAPEPTPAPVEPGGDEPVLPT
jgi:hypothetical protein